jgi:hypothetical protein
MSGEHTRMVALIAKSSTSISLHRRVLKLGVRTRGAAMTSVKHPSHALISHIARSLNQKMSPIRHSTQRISMKIDEKNCTEICFCDGCNLLKNCKLCHCM